VEERGNYPGQQIRKKTGNISGAGKSPVHLIRCVLPGGRSALEYLKKKKRRKGKDHRIKGKNTARRRDLAVWAHQTKGLGA